MREKKVGNNFVYKSMNETKARRKLKKTTRALALKKRNKKRETKHVRLDINLYVPLRNEAYRNQVTMSKFTDQIIKNYFQANGIKVKQKNTG